MSDTPQSMLAALIDRDANIRSAAHQHFRLTFSEHLGLLMETALGANAKLSIAAANILIEGWSQLQEERVFRLLTSKNLLVADLILNHLEEHQPPAVSSLILIEALPHCEPLIQINIVVALGRLGCVNAVQPLMTLLATTEWVTLRYVIIEALGLLGDRTAITVIQQYHDDTDENVRQRAQNALRRLTHPTHVYPPGKFSP